MYICQLTSADVRSQVCVSPLFLCRYIRISRQRTILKVIIRTIYFFTYEKNKNSLFQFYGLIFFCIVFQGPFLLSTSTEKLISLTFQPSTFFCVGVSPECNPIFYHYTNKFSLSACLVYSWIGSLFCLQKYELIISHT